jgi:RNase P/RNase MRP subunit p29
LITNREDYIRLRRFCQVKSVLEKNCAHNLEWVMETRIDEIRNGMRNIHIEGKIVDMNQFMLVVDDESGRTFVRYNYRNLAKPIQKGDYVRIDNGEAVNYSGILQLKLPRNGSITLTNLDNPSPSPNSSA